MDDGQDSSVDLKTVLGALSDLVKLPTRAAASSQTPTSAALQAFVHAVPDAAAVQLDLPSETVVDGSAQLGQAEVLRLVRASGKLALWGLVKVDGLMREEERQAAGKGDAGPPSYPVSAAPLMMLLLARMTVQFLQPTFVQVSSTTSPGPSITPKTQRFTEITSSDDESRPRTPPRPSTLELTTAVRALLDLATQQPFTLVTKLVRDVGVMRPVLKIAVSLGWNGKEEYEVVLRKPVLKLLDSYHPSQTMSVLTPLLARPSPASQHIAQLLSRALLAPHGLRGLLQSMFTPGSGATQETGDGIKRAEAWARLVARPPGGAEESAKYFKKIVPRLLDLLKAVDTPTMYGRPLSLALTKLLKSHPSLVLVHLHGPFIATNLARQRQRSSPARSDGEARPSDQFEALCVIVPLVLNAPPSAMIHDRLLTPIMPYLLALHWHLQTLTTADPILRTHVRDICLTWGRAANELNVQDVLRRSVFGSRGWRTEGGRLSTQKETVDRLGEDADDEEEDEWHWVGGGQDLRVVFGIPPQPDLSTPPQAGPSSAGPDDFQQEALAMLDLQPPPNLFVDFVQGIKRTRPAGQLFIDLLGRLHRPEDDETPENPFGDLLVSKVVMRMAEVMGEELAKGEEVRILEFVNLVLRPSDGGSQAAPAASTRPPTSTGLGMTDLRIVEEPDDPLSEMEEDDGEESELDSDDEVDLPAREDAENMGLDDGRDASGTSEGKMGIIGTAVGLLIAVLQADEQLSPASNSLLVVIKASLERHATSSLPSVRHLCKEALLILSLRSATSSLHSTKGKASSTPDQLATEAALERYQEALKLIADPSVPVRAHGLILLRQLVLSPTQQVKERPSASPNARLPEALVPGIMDVFVQSIQDSDSYVYLNAVKGLAGMVDGHGKDVLGRLMRVYAKGVGNNGWMGSGSTGGKGKAREGAEMDVKDLDTRLRVGEALCGVIERCEAALGRYGDVLIPPLLLVFRASSLPTSLRASSLSILSLVAETSPLAFSSHVNNLILASVDLLSVETVARPRQVTPVQPVDPQPLIEQNEEDEGEGMEEPEQDRPAVVADNKHPMLRRTALKFLASSIVADSHLDKEEVDQAAWSRVGTVVGYVKATDVDPHVRSLAGEVSILLKNRLMSG